MKISPIDDSQRTATRVARFAYRVTFAAVVCVNFGIHYRLIVENNAETARNNKLHQDKYQPPECRKGVLMAIAGLGWLTYLSNSLVKYLSPYNLAADLLWCSFGCSRCA
jgi:hypothetical protein